MKPQYATLLKQVDELAGRVGHRQRPWLRVVIVEGEDPKPAQEKAVAAWLAAHPRAKKRTTEDFDWILRTVARQWTLPPEHQTPDSPASNNADVFADEEERARQFRRRLHYPPAGLA